MAMERKEYIAPEAEVILFGPSEALAAMTDEDAFALQQWGWNNDGAEDTSSTITGGGVWDEY